MGKLKEKLLDLKDSLENYKIALEEWYCDLYNLCSEYDIEWYLDDIVSIDVVEDIAKQQLEDGWLARLYYFMWDVNWNTAEIVRIDGYWNCEEVRSDDLIDIIDEIIDDKCE